MRGTLVGLELDCARPQKSAAPPPARCMVTGESATLFEWGRKYYKLTMIDEESRPYVARLTKKGAPRLTCAMRIYSPPPPQGLGDAQSTGRRGADRHFLLHEEVAKCWRDASFYVREVLFKQPGVYALEFELCGEDLGAMFASSPAPLRYTCTVARGEAHTHRAMPSQQTQKRKQKLKPKPKPKRARTDAEEQIDATRARCQKARATGKLVLSESLLKCVVADWTSVVQRGEVAPLPCSADQSVDAILARFAAHVAASRKSQREDSTAGLIAAVPHLLERFLHTSVLFHSAASGRSRSTPRSAAGRSVAHGGDSGATGDMAGARGGARRSVAVPRESECDRYAIFYDLLKSEEQRTLSVPLDDAKNGS